VLPELLADPDPAVRRWGAVVATDLLSTGEVEPQDVEPLVLPLAEHPDPQVRALAVHLLTELRSWCNDPGDDAQPGSASWPEGNRPR
jgi:HEAT repeats